MTTLNKKRPLAACFVPLCLCAFVPFSVTAAAAPTGKTHTNSIGMEFVRIDPGEFQMGFEGGNLPESVIAGERGVESRIGGDYDEKPAHKVKITKSFYMGATEVTIGQFRKFRPDYPGYDQYRPYASAISWHEAQAFCRWLSGKEGVNYRLPTEAEWEYTCRAGTRTPFWSGDALPEAETANPWGLKNMHTGIAEWTADWHGIYPDQDQVDPAGPADGLFKVARGAPMDWLMKTCTFYRRSANRSALPPAYGPPPVEYQYKQLLNSHLTYNIPEQLKEEALNDYKIENLQNDDITLCLALNTAFRYVGLGGNYAFLWTSGYIPGRHEIGFRVVLADEPTSQPAPQQKPFWHRCVKQTGNGLEEGPDPSEPYYRTRLIFPDFGEVPLETVWRIGVERGYGGEHHNSALAVLPNGDMVSLYYNTNLGTERDACVSIMSQRLRHGSNRWDMPSPWPDVADADDEGPVMWNDNGTIWLFWGCPRKEACYPFQYTKSTDNGATWSQVEYPLFEARVGPYAAQPISSAFRDSKGTIYLAVDGSHPPATSLLFASRNNGGTWYDTGGRTYGRHSTFIILEDDVIMALGGKQADIDGFHPLNISRDGGTTYDISASPLPALGGGRRASLIKLQNGKLFYVADMHLNHYGKLTPDMAPPGYVGHGSYAALSGDNGQTWICRKLTGGNVLDKDASPVKINTVSYVMAAQDSAGIIHVITSHNHPDLHFELNESWIRQGKEGPGIAAPLDVQIRPDTVKQYTENYPCGKPMVVYSAGIGADGHYLLHGTETWYYIDGQKKWQTTYRAGDPVNTETYWNGDGSIAWTKVYADDATHVWTVYRPDGNIKSKSKWHGRKLLDYELAG